MRQLRLASLILSMLFALGAIACSDSGGSSSNHDAGTASDDSGPTHEEEDGIGYTTLSRSNETDILWVIDNTGSMCEEQKALRDSFGAFLDKLVGTNVDFHIGVTTTQMTADHSPEPIARPGRLQSMPQPVPMFPTCFGDEGLGDASDGFQPIRSNLEAVINDCTKDPAQWQSLEEVTDDEIACHLDRSCGEPWELFPTTASGEQPNAETDPSESPYRQIPRVLRAEDYRNPETGRIDGAGIQRLERDLGCMSFVGTSGYGVEKGLAAAVEAVSPEMTGGATDAPEDQSAPNHGLLRQDASFAVVFFTDENDCSHDGSLAEDTACLGDICAFANNPDLQDSPLLATSQLADELRSNLSASKGRQIGDEWMTVASIHGAWRRYGEDYPDSSNGDPVEPGWCTADSENRPDDSLREQASCENAFGSPRSGDRYERFLRNFSRTFPEAPSGAGEHMDGLMCRPDEFSASLSGMAEKIAAPTQPCLTRPLYRCEAGSSEGCPSFRYEETQPKCLTDGAGNSICESAIAVELLAPPDATDPRSELESTGYCIAESIEMEDGRTRCVTDRSKYRFAGCEGGLNIEWQSEMYFADLEGIHVRLRYLTENWEPDTGDQ